MPGSVGMMRLLNPECCLQWLSSAWDCEAELNIFHIVFFYLVIQYEYFIGICVCQTHGSIVGRQRERERGRRGGKDTHREQECTFINPIETSACDILKRYVLGT